MTGPPSFFMRIERGERLGRVGPETALRATLAGEPPVCTQGYAASADHGCMEFPQLRGFVDYRPKV